MKQPVTVQWAGGSFEAARALADEKRRGDPHARRVAQGEQMAEAIESAEAGAASLAYSEFWELWEMARAVAVTPDIMRALAPVLLAIVESGPAPAALRRVVPKWQQRRTDSLRRKAARAS